MSLKTKEFFNVLAVIFPLTLIIPPMLIPALNHFTIAPGSAIGTLLIDVVIIGLAVFIFLPALEKITRTIFSH
ncbi:hypothetical protein [Photobacterium sp. OFAV2-7]|uniref:hypothetical protein n=1 Tax=Photobacterium sp. OFAV2-7 TaxID=2917748 RepID=UPI001EF4BAEB|nr:hypothetical protein [Photobacterium sp. OFAV2-7]MCG7584309.1 hypothetical protein [Photobacterium sp. OFAV2-7]